MRSFAYARSLHMARFPVSFGKRKPAVAKEDGEVVPSFRVLERTDVEGVKTFDGSSRPARPTSTVRPYSQVDNLAEEENMFTGLKVNRYVDSTTRCFILVRSEASESVRGSVPRDVLHGFAYGPPVNLGACCLWSWLPMGQGCAACRPP